MPTADLAVNVQSGRPTGQPPHATLHNEERTEINSLRARLAQLEANPYTPAVYTSPGEVALDSFASNGSDSDKLDAAIADHARLIALGGNNAATPRYRAAARKYSLTRSIGLPPNGFSVEGAGRGQLSGVSTGKPNQHTTFKIECPKLGSDPFGYFINVPAGVTCWNGYWNGINAYSDNGVTQFVRASGGSNSQIREWTMPDLTFQGFSSVLGNKAEYLALTICNFGMWSIFDTRAQAIHIGGSDNRQLWTGLDFFQSGTYPGNGDWMMRLNNLQKSNVNAPYLTAVGGWRGILVTNGNASGLNITGAVLEGTNANAPSMGALLRIESGGVSVRDTAVNFGMSNPAATATPNGGTADRGLIEVLGSAQAVFDGMSFGHAAGVALTTPVLYAGSTAEVAITHTLRADRGGTAWGSTKPVVMQAVSGRVYDSDASVAVRTG